MRNLKLLYRQSLKYDGVKAKFIVHHPLNENVSFVYDGGSLKSLHHATNEAKDLCSYENVMAMDFIQLNECLCFATEEGEIVQYNLSNGDLEVVGLISDGIEAMSWSPDQELVVFVTKSLNVVLMFSTYDVLVESSLHEKAAKEFITVGWGKKETQFHGSEGKDSRKKEAITIDNVNELDTTVTCCWREDGEFFAVNHVGANGRMFKVYDKEGNLQYTSEIRANLQVPMAWKPSGLWICKPEIHKDNKYTITLFERNGLRHNELVLPFSPDVEEVVNLSWSLDSDVFLIETCRNGTLSCLYFYTICNYHWYLKHYEEFDEKVVYAWSQNYSEPKQFHLITSNGAFQTLKFDFVVSNSNGSSESDETIVAVVDGFKLLLSNFKSQIVPPPMASLEVSLKVPVNEVSFLQHPTEDFDSNSFLTLDHKNHVTIYRCLFETLKSGKNLNGTEVVKEFTLKLEQKNYSNIVWLNGEHILVTHDNVVSLCLLDSGSIVANLETEKVVGSVATLSQDRVIVQLTDGKLLELEVNSNQISITDSDLDKLPEFCEKVVATFVNRETKVYASKHIKKKLYFNSREIANEVTSFAVTSDNDYLIYTTIGELKFLDVAKSNPQIVESRKVERGSKIISLVKDKAQIVFQLPRGNLESVSPRILSVKIIKRLLSSSAYALAFDLMRKERINLNLLLDVNPQKFLKELSLFIDQIDNIQWLNLFLNELKNEDVTTTMYSFCTPATEDTEIFDSAFKMDNKIVYICQKMMEIFQNRDPIKYILPSITCHVKTEKLESALEMIWNVKKSGSGDKTAEDALKYLLYLIDINLLYNIALGMYDYQLVLFVAQKSQKDPKEYVPFLNELNKLPPAYAKFKIDCFLKRFPKAVKHISELSDDESKFDECIELVKKHSLYEAAMVAFEEKPEKYQKICVLYGDFLRVKGKILDASLMYERGGEFQQALSGARNLLDWQRCMMLARKLNTPEGEMKESATKLLHSLKEAGRWRDAADLVRRFLSDDCAAVVDTLAKGKFYPEAILEAALMGKPELLDEIIRPQLHQHLTDVINSVANDRRLYLEQKERLLFVRSEKVKKMQHPDEDDDMFSETTSIASSQNSRSSSKTFRSSKTRRKHERKLMNLKEGNKYEDVALIDSIWKLVHKVISSENQQMVRDLLKAAVDLKVDELGKALQKSFKDLLLLLKFSMDEVWIPEIMLAGKYPETEEEMLQYNLDHSMSSKLAYELIQPAQRFKPKMNVTDFEMELYWETSRKL